MTAPPFAHSSGPRTAKLALVGVAWGEQEELVGQPFVGASGQELNKLLAEVGLRRSECFATNVFALRPEGNNIEKFTAKKAEAGGGAQHPPLHQGAYFREEFLPELARLREELDEVRPNLVLALGATACWALLASAKIGALRGSVTQTHKGFLARPLKVLPTHHPAVIFHNWALRPIVQADLLKAERECRFAEIRRPHRELIVEPSLEDVLSWFERPAQAYSCDTETLRGQIEMIGFARSRSDAIVIPFVDLGHPGRSYWPDLETELIVRRVVYGALASSIPKIFQNGLYDLQYLVREGCYPRNCCDDTMLKHHSMYPELEKGLGFLGSIYSNEQSWKLLRHEVANKKDE